MRSLLSLAAGIMAASLYAVTATAEESAALPLAPDATAATAKGSVRP